MNIKRAKEEILHTLRAYLDRDALGNYRIAPVRQRPILLIGPPGIGKTQIVEQAASESGVGLVSYTITHHTRQSAMGLPFIEKRVYGGTEYAVTEYTMSEILASVHRLMERTGLREGILFLDEINCVSETLAPMMLQFLQYKTFGNQRLPEGWLIVTAGNPAEYNRSVREFDLVTLDRMRRISVEADYSVWKEYALRKGLHGAVLSYLDIRREDFYCLETDVDGPKFVTARGWEDLSELLQVYESLGMKAGRETVEEYLQLPRVAREFANYLELYDKYRRAYQAEAILEGHWTPLIVSELREAPFDEKLSVLGMLLSGLSESAREVWRQDALTVAVHADLTAFRERLKTDSNAANIGKPDAARIMAEIAGERRETLERVQAAGHQEAETRTRIQREIRVLEDYAQKFALEPPDNSDAAMDAVRDWFSQLPDERTRLGTRTGEQFDNVFGFLEEAAGEGQELVLFVTELTAGFYTSWFVEEFGCEAYFRHNRELLFDDRRKQLREKILDLNG